MARNFFVNTNQITLPNNESSFGLSEEESSRNSPASPQNDISRPSIQKDYLGDITDILIKNNLNQAQTINIGIKIKEKLVELLKDVQNIHESYEEFPLIIDQMISEIERKKIYKVDFSRSNMVQDIVFEENFERSGAGLDTKRRFYPYISLKNILLDILSNQTLCRQMKDFPDDWKRCQKYDQVFEGANELHLSLYGDEITITEALSTRSVKHKYYMLYCSLLNYSAEQKSSENSIHFISMINSIDLKSIGINKFLTPVVEDIKSLETFKFKGEIYKLKLCVVCGDTPASQQLGGNRLNFFINYIFRFFDWSQ